MKYYYSVNGFILTTSVDLDGDTASFLQHKILITTFGNKMALKQVIIKILYIFENSGKIHHFFSPKRYLLLFTFEQLGTILGNDKLKYLSTTEFIHNNNSSIQDRKLNNTLSTRRANDDNSSIANEYISKKMKHLLFALFY